MIKPQMKIPPATPGEVTEKYTLAVNLNCKIKAAAQLAQQSLYEMCSGFKKMRDDKLYKELGYSDFGDYCEQETGLSRQNVYNYIAIVEKLPKDFVAPGRQIGYKKLYLLTTLSETERIEITQNNDVENTSVRELERQIKELRDKNTAAEQEKIALESKIKELENRPIETVIEHHEKIPAGCIDLKAYEKTVSDYNEKLERADGEYIEMKRELSKEIDELKNQLDNSRKSDSVKDVFTAYRVSAERAINALAKFVADHSEYAGMAVEMLENHKKTLEGLR